MIALMKRQAGNETLTGATIGILGITELLKPLQVPAAIAGFDIWVMLATTAMLILVAISG